MPSGTPYWLKEAQINKNDLKCSRASSCGSPTYCPLEFSFWNITGLSSKFAVWIAGLTTPDCKSSKTGTTKSRIVLFYIWAFCGNGGSLAFWCYTYGMASLFLGKVIFLCSWSLLLTVLSISRSKSAINSELLRVIKHLK